MPSYFRFIWPTTARFVLAVYHFLALSALNSPLLYGQAPYSSVRWLLYLSFGLEVQAFRDLRSYGPRRVRGLFGPVVLLVPPRARPL